MANIIKPKRSTVANKVPTTGDLVNGEIAINSTDQKIYTSNGAAVVQVGAGKLSALGEVSITSPSNGEILAYNGSAWVNQAGGGAGDVTGPASSTDNALVRFDGTTGKLIQNGTVTQDDNGTLAAVNAISFATSPVSTPTATGSMFWDSGDGAPNVIIGPNVTLQMGQENVVKVYNGTGATIANGSVVAVVGAQGQRPSVALADADTEALSAATLGLATESIANGAEGFVTTFGLVRGIDTSAFTAGAPIYLSSTAGQFTATKPVAPAHTVFLGWVVKVNASSGEVFVNISNGWELDELHNVLITSPTNGQTLVYNSSTGLWVNGTLGGASVTVSTTAPATPSAGDLWWDSTYGRLMIYYTDADGSQWVTASLQGPAGPAGIGLPTGGTTGQVLAKSSGTNYDVAWVNQTGGVTSFNTRTGAVTLLSADVLSALGYTPVNKAGDTMTGALTVQGQIYTTTGGIKFPDGSTQTTSAASVAIATAIVFGG